MAYPWKTQSDESILLRTWGAPSWMDAQPCPGKVPDCRDKHRPISEHLWILGSLGTRLLVEGTGQILGCPWGWG